MLLYTLSSFLTLDFFPAKFLSRLIYAWLSVVVWEAAFIECEVDKVANVDELLYRDNEFCDDSSNTDVFLERLRGGWSSFEDRVEVEKPWTKSILRI